MPKLLLILLQRPSIFTTSQLDKLADAFINVGVLIFGSTIAPFIIPGLDKPPFSVLVFGVLACSFFWGLALRLVRSVTDGV